MPASSRRTARCTPRWRGRWPTASASALAVDGKAADVGVSTTGIAGPDSPDGQPVGTVFVGIATPLGARVESLQLQGTRDAIRHEAARRAILLAIEAT